MIAPRPWDPAAPLERGVTLLEASAGTGKTWNIAELVLRLVVEQGLAMREILVVTFTRAATGELRDRVRLRLAEAAVEAQGEDQRRLRAALESFDECLIATIHGFCQRTLQQFAFESGVDFDLELVADSEPLIDELITDWLSSELHAHDPARYRFSVEACRFRPDDLGVLARLALRDPDMAVLPVDREPPTAWGLLLSSFAAAWRGGWRDDLVAAVLQARADKRFKPRQRTVNENNTRAAAAQLDSWLADASPQWPSLPTSHTWWLAKLPGVLADPTQPFAHPALDALADLVAAHNRRVASERARFVDWVRAEFAARNLRRRQQSYQDLLRSLAQALDPAGDPVRRRALVKAVRARYQAVLIDEFQDTDALQWGIFSALFDDGQRWMYLIGDPKQAIYGFRGANVRVYLTARSAAGSRCYTMDRNWRSDQRYLDAINHLLDRPGIFAVEGIPYVPVHAPPKHRADRLLPPAGEAPVALQLRYADARLMGADAPGPVERSGGLDEQLAQRVAADIVALLESGTRLRDGDIERPLGPSDVAVLTRTGKQAGEVQAALRDRGVPAVRAGEGDVFRSDEAAWLTRWLAAAIDPGRDSAARAAATTPLFGHSGDELRAIEDEQPSALRRWDGWLESLRHWGQLLNERGFLPALRTALNDEDVRVRLLSLRGGDRHLTNLLHLAELVHQREAERRLGARALLDWLQQQRLDRPADAQAAELRLERDDEAVSVMTTHRAKGLQFGVVFLPSLGSSRLPGARDPAWIVPDTDDPTARQLELRTEELDATLRRAGRAQREEDLRVLYVALTRACHRSVLYCGPWKSLSNSPLAPALLGEAPDRITTGSERAADPDALQAALEELVAGSQSSLADGLPTIGLTTCLPAPSDPWRRPPQDRARLAVRRFTAPGPTRHWKRHSYTALTREQGTVYVVGDGTRPAFDADALQPGHHETPAAFLPRYTLPADGEPVPLAEFPAGADAGVFLHAFYEHADFTAAHPERGDEAALGRVLDSLMPRHGVEERWRDLLITELTATLRTPLGGPLGAWRLCDCPRDQRLDELSFDFPVAGGDQHGSADHAQPTRSAEIVAALQRREPDEDLRAPYLGGLSHLRLGDLSGFLTGSIDLVFRAPVDGQPRWFVADYKSNRLDPRRTKRHLPQHYAHEGLRFAMEQHHYYLQYHLYTLALHRYLGWRLGDRYDYDRDFGGVYYLFLRGMQGPDTPTEGDRRHGAFYDRPPREVIEALDAAFAQPGVTP